MGARPRRDRKTAEVIALHGNAGKHSKEELEKRADEDVVAEKPSSLDPPKDLTGYAREAWRQHAPELDRLGLLTKLDLGGFRLACEDFALAMSALEAMRPKKADGTPDGRRKGYEVLEVDRAHGGMAKKHPAFSVFNMAQSSYLAWCREFGMTPAGRLGLRPAARGGAPAGGEPSVSDDDFDDAFDLG